MNDVINEKKSNILANVFPIFFKLKKHLRLISLCVYRIQKNENFDKNYSSKLLINNQEFDVGLLFHNGIKCFSLGIYNYYINFLYFKIECEKLLLFPIQNPVRLIFKKENNVIELLIIYNLLDIKKGTGRHSKIYFYENINSVCYFRQGIRNSLNITIRKRNVTDESSKRIKIFFAWLLSKITFYRKIVLLYEKESNKYEESASIVYEKLIDMDYNNIYFILNETSLHNDFVSEKYRNHIIKSHTFKHYYYFFMCNRFIGTESIMHSIELRIANRFASIKLNKKKYKYVFLQHGVMYMVSLDSHNRGAFRKGKEMPLDAKIVVSSKKEAKHFIDLGNFDEEDLYITGLPSFDRIIPNKNADKITIMPTWRPWDFNVLKANYKQSSYYNMINQIIKNIPKKYHDKVILLPHPLVLNDFKETPLGKMVPNIISYNKIMEQTALLITDYSSISYPAFYRGSNVIFCWEEKEECFKHYGGRLMLNEKNVFGDISRKYSDIKELVKKNYLQEQTELYKKRYQKIVNFSDGNNTERLIEKLINDHFFK